MGTMTYTGTLVVQVCCNCGMTFAVPQDFDTRRLKDHGRFFCPAGHGQSYTGKSEEEKLRAQLAREEGRSASLAYDLKYAEGRRRAEKAAKTKLKNRIAKGVCPCCQRHFANVQRHISNQHPEFAAAGSEETP